MAFPTQSSGGHSVSDRARIVARNALMKADVQPSQGTLYRRAGMAAPTSAARWSTFSLPQEEMVNTPTLPAPSIDDCLRQVVLVINASIDHWLMSTVLDW